MAWRESFDEARAAVDALRSRADDAALLPIAVQRIEGLAGGLPQPSSIGAVPAAAPDLPVQVRAAGIMFLTPDKRVLFLQRGPGGDHGGEWCFPGGGIEGDETPEQCAVRETKEETGHVPDTPRTKFCRRIKEGVDFTTFMQKVVSAYVPELNDESVGYAWASYDHPPEPLHPGCRIALAKLDMDELGIARAMQSGELTSPQHYENIALFALRITGTRTSYRKKLDEYVYRPPEHYLTPDFLTRCNGLTVVWEHPKTNVLDSREFADRVVGSIVLPYIVGDEVWGIAKIYDTAAIELMSEGQLSTSPAVVFRDPAVNSKLELDDGSTLLIEGKPSLLDHLAICEKGVWDKGGEPSGVKSDDIRGDADVAEDKKEEKMDAAKSDATKVDTSKADAARADEKLDKMLSHLDSIQKHCDSLTSRMDAMEDEKKKADAAKADAAKKADAEKEEEKKKADAAAEEAKKADAAKKDADPGKPMETAADKAKKDAEEKEKADAEKAEKEKMDAAKADAAKSGDKDDISERIARIEASLPKVLSDDELSKMADAQARADAHYAGFGMRAPRPLEGETCIAYRRRLAQGLQQHSSAWAKTNLRGLTDDVLAIAETQIFADSDRAALHPVDMPGGGLREIKRRDTTGREISSFVGPRTFISGMNRSGRMVRKFGPPRAA